MRRLIMAPVLAVIALVAAVLLATTAGAATVSFTVTPTAGPGTVTIDWNVAPQDGRSIESITASSEPATDFAGPVEDAVGTLSINVPRSGTYTFTVEVLESGADEPIVESRTVEVTSAAPPADEEEGEAQPETEPSPDPEATTGDETPTRPTDIPDAGVTAGPTSTSRDDDGTAPAGPLRSAD